MGKNKFIYVMSGLFAIPAILLCVPILVGAVYGVDSSMGDLDVDVDTMIGATGGDTEQDATKMVDDAESNPYVSGKALVQNNDGTWSVKMGLDHTGNISVTGGLTVEKASNIIGNVYVGSGDISVEEGAKIDGNAEASGNFILASGARVTGTLKVGGNLTVGEGAYIGKDIGVGGVLKIANGVNIDGDIYVSGSSNITMGEAFDGKNLTGAGSLSIGSGGNINMFYSGSTIVIEGKTYKLPGKIMKIGVATNVGLPYVPKPKEGEEVEAGGQTGAPDLSSGVDSTASNYATGGPIDDDDEDDSDGEDGFSTQSNGVANRFIEAALSGQLDSAIDEYIPAVIERVLEDEIIPEDAAVIIKDLNKGLIKTDTVNINTKSGEVTFKSLMKGDSKVVTINQGDIVATTNATLTIEDNEAFVVGPDKLKTSIMMPLETINAANIVENTIKAIGLKMTEKNPAYEVIGERKEKFLGIFKVDVPFEFEIDAVSGQTLSKKMPWWSFLSF